ncbi:MAG: IS3 family transposase [Prevotella sp.]|nr:IS3 family transposase [Prevotella sp.]MCX4294713.1 IS3 family transposase [Prevotella sp.]
MDECGDHNHAKYDPGFPVFTLCGILVSRQNLNALNKAFEDLKEDIFGTKDVVIHSVDIRKWRGPFSILADESARVRFFEGIERILSRHEAYVIVSCTILKEQLNKFCVRGEEDDVYGLSLSYLIERSIFYVDNNDNEGSPEISVVVERRGKKEDNKLLDYFNGLRNRGTKWVEADRLRSRVRDFGFKNKKDNIIGLQIADLIAYPVTIHLLHPERNNPFYEAVKHNIIREKENIKSIFHEHKGRYGYRRVTAEMCNRGFIINHKTVQRLMNTMCLKSQMRKVRYRSYKGEVGRIAPNIINRDFVATAPNQKWATDVTQINIGTTKLSLSYA